jgi:hypothetical protein
VLVVRASKCDRFLTLRGSHSVGVLSGHRGPSQLRVQMGEFSWCVIVVRCEYIGPWVATMPNPSVLHCRRFIGRFRGFGLSVPIVHPFVGDRWY